MIIVQMGDDYRTFQFTHPGGVRHLPHSGRHCVITVSIHAPGRGATVAGA